MTLSVVVAARDAADTIADTLDSLLRQTRADWEAIIVDDGSVDSTVRIAETFATRDPRIRVLSDGRPSEGPAAARNRGIAEVGGQWLVFLDADDWIETAYVEKMIGALEARSGTRLAYCSSCNIAVDGRRSEPWFSKRIALAPFETLARECPLLIHTVVIERNLVLEVGGFEPSMPTGEDADFWQRVARTGASFFPVPEATVFYRVRANSLSTGARRRLAVGRAIIECGFGPDPRVPHPDPRYAAGASGGSDAEKAAALAYLTLWCAAFDIAEGGDGKGFVTSLPDCPGGIFKECCVQILGGLAAGARVPAIDASFDVSPTLVPAVRNLLRQAEQAAGRPGLARLLECALEPEIFRPDRLTERLVAGRSMFVRQDVRRLQPIAAPPSVDTLHVEFRAGTRCLGRHEVLAFSVVSAREMTVIAIDAISPTIFLKESRLLRHPFFWLRMSVELVRLPVRLLADHPDRGTNLIARPRGLARKLVVAAASGMTSGRSPATVE